MTTKIFITLVGGDQVEGGIKKIGDSLQQLKGLSNPDLGLDKLNVQFTQATQSTEGLRASSSGLVEGLHVLRPALQEAGLAIGNVREIGVLARLGVEGLGIALGAGLAVAAAKAADAMANLQRSFQFLFGSTGETALANLKKNTDDLGTSVTSLAPALETALNALSRLSTFKGIDLSGKTTFGSPDQIELVTNAISALQKQFLVLGETGPEADKSVALVVDAISKLDPKTSKPLGLTLQAFQDLQTKSPEAAKAISNAFQQNLGVSDLFTELKTHSFDFLTTMRAIAATKVTLDVQPIPPTVAKSLEDVKTAFNNILEASGKNSQVPGFLDGIKNALVSLSPLIQGVVGNIASFGSTVAQFFGDIGRLGSAIATAFSTGNFAPALEAAKKLITDLVGNLINGVENALGGLPSRVIAFFQSIDWGAAWLGLLEAEKNALEFVGTAIASGFNAIVSKLAALGWSGVFDGLLSAAQTVIQALTSAFTTFFTWLKSQNLSVGGGSLSGGFEVPAGGAAGGGHIRGPGSSTSDSILAWLSNNEFVVRSAAVSHYGVDLMHAINSMRLPKDFFRGFNMGGLVMPAFPSAPRFAQGGPVGGSRSLTLVLGGQNFALAGARNTVDELERAADMHNLSRLGRAPGWVK